MTIHSLALPTTVADIIDEYDEKIANVEKAISEFAAAHTKMQSATVVQGRYVERVVDDVYLRPDTIKQNLRKSGWKAVYARLQIENLASAQDKRLFEQTLANPPELTFDNAKATFGDYLLRPRFHKLRGLAECFVNLDPAYKSHSKVKIGVSGLPKRIILSAVGAYGSWGRERLRDVLNALAAMQGVPLVEHAEIAMLDEFCRTFDAKAGEVAFDGHEIKRYEDGQYQPWSPPDRGVKVKVYQNGNGHLIFEPQTLLLINRALAEFYGEVLPDVEEEDTKKRPGTGVAKDLQYYPTPVKVVERVLDEVGLCKVEDRWGNKSEPKNVLEPSCGDGRFLDALRLRGHHVVGVEVDPGRAAQAKAKGHHNVHVTNFLETAPNPVFDFVVMNPPFFGLHYRRHLEQARKFLKPGGQLVSILPASAWYDHGGLEGKWHDLPVASFAESGTNVPTGFIVMRAA